MRFSIIIPAYNAAKFIRRSLDSVCSQDYDNEQFEIIIVDDCSPDNQCLIIEEYMKSHSNIRLIKHAKNKKQGGARNTALREAKGEYILFLDADDFWLSNKVLVNIDRILNIDDSIDLLHFTCYSTTNPAFSDSISSIGDIVYWDREDFQIRPNFSCCSWLGCYKRDIIIKNECFFREYCFYEDTDWCRRIVTFCTIIASIEYPFYYYSTNNASVTRTISYNTLKFGVLANAFTCDYFTKHPLNSILKHKMLKDNILWGGVICDIRGVRNFTIKEGCELLKIYGNTSVVDFNEYIPRYKTYILLMVLKYCPIILVSGIKLATKIKRIFAK